MDSISRATHFWPPSLQRFLSLWLAFLGPWSSEKSGICRSRALLGRPLALSWISLCPSPLFSCRQARPEPWCVLYYYIRGPLYLPNRRGEERIAAAGGPGWTLFCSRALARARRDGGRRKRGGSTTTRDEVGCIGLLGAAVGGAAAGGRLCKGPFFPGGTKRADCL